MAHIRIKRDICSLERLDSRHAFNIECCLINNAISYRIRITFAIKYTMKIYKLIYIELHKVIANNLPTISTRGPSNKEQSGYLNHQTAITSVLITKKKKNSRKL